MKRINLKSCVMLLVVALSVSVHAEDVLKVKKSDFDKNFKYGYSFKENKCNMLDKATVNLFSEAYNYNMFVLKNKVQTSNKEIIFELLTKEEETIIVTSGMLSCNAYKLFITTLDN